MVLLPRPESKKVMSSWSVGGKKIRSFEQFKDAVNAADKTLALQVVRDGSRTFLAVKT